MEDRAAPSGHTSGFVAIVGRPNAGKSTFLNAVLGQKIAITSSKPQTTRRRIMGVKTLPAAQIVFVDTPGFFPPLHALGRFMQDTIRQEARQADVVLWFVDLTTDPRPEDLEVARFLFGQAAGPAVKAAERAPAPKGPGRKKRSRPGKPVHAPVLLIANKIDVVSDPALQDRRVAAYQALGPVAEVIRISAAQGRHVDEVVAAALRRLPEGPPYFPPDAVTDLDDRVRVEELIREQVLAGTRQEVPHAVAVEVQEMKPGVDPAVTVIWAVLYVERESQKGILVGKGGARLKAIGTAARKSVEAALGRKVFLELWVKVKQDWRDREDWLRALGYDNE